LRYTSFSMWRRFLLASLISAGGLIVPCHLPAQDIGLPIGSTPSAVQIEDLEGNAVDLGDYVGAGKPVLVEFWATWCPNCKALEPQLRAAHEEYGDEVEFLIIAVAVNQSLRRVRQHTEENEMPGRVLWDGDGKAVRAFSAPATSYIALLDAEGKVVYTGLGKDQDIEAALQNVVGRGADSP
jgi:thiol-disulfide isomerase/thioredoxin